jgi:hypothetical protein
MNNEEFIKYLFKEYLNRTYFTRDELNFHSNEINLNIKTKFEKEIEFKQCHERVLYLNSKISEPRSAKIPMRKKAFSKYTTFMPFKLQSSVTLQS